MTRNLSASGSRNAPERVAPSRRASQPSSRSVHASTNHSVTVSHVEPRSQMSSSVGTARSSRATVTKFAGVAIADSENLLSRRALRDPRHRARPALRSPARSRSLRGRRTAAACSRQALRHEIGAEGVGDVGTDERAGAGPLGVEVHDAVDLGCLAEGATDEQRRTRRRARRRARRSPRPRARRVRRG